MIPKNLHTKNIAEELLRPNKAKSPCINICTIHPRAKICVGCFRTAREITVWSKINDEERKQILSQLPTRSSLLKKRRGGRKSRSVGKG